MPGSYAEVTIWLVIVVVGVATFAFRGSFIALFGRLEEVPPGVKRVLRFVPAAVLAALVAPSLITVGAAGGVATDKLVAGAIAAAVAWRTERVIATMAAGMGALWTLRFVL